MAKAICDFCGKEIGFMSKWKLKDGVICFDCIRDLDKKITRNSELYTKDQIRRIKQGELEVVPPQKYNCQEGTVTIDPVNRVMFLTLAFPIIKMWEISLDSIIGYNYVENEKKYGVGRTAGGAIVGGLVFGGVGAVVGAALGSNHKKTIKYMGIEISYEKDGACETCTVNLHKGKPIKPGGFDYNCAQDVGRSLMGELDLLIQKREDIPQQAAFVQESSSADEIRKFKELLDDGIITQEEFEAKKKELLGGSGFSAQPVDEQLMENPQSETNADNR